jgi:two-component system chemotaxis response regulator CheB
MAPDRRTRILIIDDSAVMRSMLRMVIGKEPSFEVAGTAVDGETGLQAIECLRPDLILLDVEMPVMDGLLTLRKLRALGNRAPVIMCSSLTQRGARVTIEVLAGGASDYVAKPAGQSDRESALHLLAQELLPKIKVLTTRTVGLLTPPSVRRSEVITPPNPTRLPPAAPAIVVIGVSTGGPAALDVVLPALGAPFPLPVLVVQHMPELFTGMLAERLNDRCQLPVCEAAEGTPVQPGVIYIARGNWHLQTVRSAQSGSRPSLHLSQTALQNHCRPSVDVLLDSATTVYGAGVLAVILTGMGSDGLAGCRTVRSLGGTVLAQDQPTSAVWGMPGAVAQAGLAHRVLPVDAIAAEILRLVPASPGDPCEFRETVA